MIHRVESQTESPGGGGAIDLSREKDEDTTRVNRGRTSLFVLVTISSSMRFTLWFCSSLSLCVTASVEKSATIPRSSRSTSSCISRVCSSNVEAIFKVYGGGIGVRQRDGWVCWRVQIDAHTHDPLLRGFHTLEDAPLAPRDDSKLSIARHTNEPL